MSYFDPHHIFKYKQRASKKGQVLRKKPIEQPRAYSGKDLEDAKKVLKAYGIPYGNQPIPPPIPPPTPPEPIIHMVTQRSSLLFAFSKTFFPNFEEEEEPMPYVEITIRDVLSRFFTTTQFGFWLTETLDPSKVVDYECTFSAKNILYAYTNDSSASAVALYDIHAATEDNTGAISYNLTINPQAGLDYKAYVFKSMTAYYNREGPYLRTEVRRWDRTDNQIVYDLDSTGKNTTDAIYKHFTIEDVPFQDLIVYDFIDERLASSTIGNLLYFNTTCFLSSIIDVNFNVSYTD